MHNFHCEKTSQARCFSPWCLSTTSRIANTILHSYTLIPQYYFACWDLPQPLRLFMAPGQRSLWEQVMELNFNLKIDGLKVAVHAVLSLCLVLCVVPLLRDPKNSSGGNKAIQALRECLSGPRSNVSSLCLTQPLCFSRTCVCVRCSASQS